MVWKFRTVRIATILDVIHIQAISSMFKVTGLTTDSEREREREMSL